MSFIFDFVRVVIVLEGVGRMRGGVGVYVVFGVVLLWKE